MTGPALRTGGYTLIEMLVVVVIIGIMLTMAMPGTGHVASVQRQVSREKFIQCIESAMFASVIGGQHLRLVTDGHRYHFDKRHSDGAWLRITDSAALKAGQLSDDVRIEGVWLDNKALKSPLRIDFIGATPPLLRMQLRDGKQGIRLETTLSGGVVQTLDPEG